MASASALVPAIVAAVVVVASVPVVPSVPIVVAGASVVVPVVLTSAVVVPVALAVGAFVAAAVSVPLERTESRQLSREELLYKVGTFHALQLAHNLVSEFGLVPEEELTLRQFLVFVVRGKHGFQGVGVYARVVHLGRQRHRGGREVLHLLKLEVQPVRLACQFGHVLGFATGVARYKVRYKLLFQSVFVVYPVKYLLEFVK